MAVRSATHGHGSSVRLKVDVPTKVTHVEVRNADKAAQVADLEQRFQRIGIKHAVTQEHLGISPQAAASKVDVSIKAKVLTSRDDLLGVQAQD